MVTFDDVKAAHARMKGVAHRTPVLTSRTLDGLVGAKVFLKCENLQRGGAFKLRGAYNTISQLSPAERAAGVIAYSSGNHAQGVALAAVALGVKAVIVMPDDVSETKLAATRDYGAKVVLHDPATSNRKDVAEELAAEHGYTIVPPFEDPRIVAGQGTAALELGEDAGPLDWLLTPVGGGGLLAGSAIAAKGLHPGCKVVGVEPEVADDAARSFRSKTLQTVHNPPTIADGTRTPSLGPEVTFPLVLEHVHDIVTVSEQAIIEAVQFLFYRVKMVVEPSGALPVAALLSGALKASGRVGVILSGGNVDGPTMQMILAGGK